MITEMGNGDMGLSVAHTIRWGNLKRKELRERNKEIFESQDS